MTLKGSGYRADIRDGIKALETKTVAFRDQADICDSERLGRVEDRQERLESHQKAMEGGN